MEAISKKRAGRPGREPSAGERVGLSLRVTPGTKRALDGAAANSGRSLSQEAEDLLQKSLMFDKLIGELRAARLWLDVARVGDRRASHLASLRGIGEDWSSDPEAFMEAMFAAIGRLLQLYPGDLDDEYCEVIDINFKRMLKNEASYRKGVSPGRFFDPAAKVSPQ